MDGDEGMDAEHPIRRENGAPAPDYALWPSKFSVCVLHGGFFHGDGLNRSYVGGKLDYFDECDQKRWSQADIDYILEALGYEASWLEHVYWLECGHGLSDGLRRMEYEKDARKIVAASLYNKSMRLYVDHTDLLGSQQLPDDVFEAKVSPMKKNLRSTAQVVKEEEESAYDENVKQADSDINDSDYDFSDGHDAWDGEEDDCEFDKNVDGDVEDGMGTKVPDQVWADDAIPADDYLQPLCREEAVPNGCFLVTAMKELLKFLLRRHHQILKNTRARNKTLASMHLVISLMKTNLFRHLFWSFETSSLCNR